MYYNESKYLFGDTELFTEMQQREQFFTKEINNLGPDYLLNTDIDKLIDYYESVYRYDVPVLLEDKITVEEQDVDIDVSNDPTRFITNRNEPFYIKGTEYIYYVPFDGDPNLFHYRATTYSSLPPMGRVEGNELIISIKSLGKNADSINKTFQNELSNVKKHLSWLERDVTNFNNRLRTTLKNLIEARISKFKKDREVVSQLGFPLRERKNSTKTFIAPEIKKKIRPQPPSSTKDKDPLSPILDDENYDHILSVINNMVTVIERSPKTFKDMNEEDLRNHFLVQLNGHYEGQATGETFNYEGKTDILIRDSGKNIFIAECKFWKGPKALLDTIDQLLGYTSWRDTKTAIIIFNRNKNFSSIVTTIPDVVKQHPNFKKELKYESETGFRYVFSHKSDTERELIITILSFDVPKDF